MRTAIRLGFVAVLACVTTLLFAVIKDSFIALLLAYPVFPGLLAGLLFSGHGGNRTVAITTALLTNSLIWCAVWLLLRRFLRVARA